MESLLKNETNTEDKMSQEVEKNKQSPDGAIWISGSRLTKGHVYPLYLLNMGRYLPWAFLKSHF